MMICAGAAKRGVANKSAITNTNALIKELLAFIWVPEEDGYQIDSYRVL